MRCVLTCVEFKFDSSERLGVHPLAFSYDLPQAKKILKQLLMSAQVCETDLIYLRIATLRFVAKVAGITYGTLRYRKDDIPDQFSPEEFIGDVKLALHLFDTELPELKKLKVKELPCKRTVEFLQGVFQTYLKGKNYTPFKQYLETTMLSELAIEAIMNYDLMPCQRNLDIMQITLSGQESLLELPTNESNFYNRKKMIKVIAKINEFPIFKSKGILNVHTKDTSSEDALQCPTIKVKIF